MKAAWNVDAVIFLRFESSSSRAVSTRTSPVAASRCTRRPIKTNPTGRVLPKNLDFRGGVSDGRSRSLWCPRRSRRSRLCVVHHACRFVTQLRHLLSRRGRCADLCTVAFHAAAARTQGRTHLRCTSPRKLPGVPVGSGDHSTTAKAQVVLFQEVFFPELRVCHSKHLRDYDVAHVFA